ncbi:MAG: hypothetical protein R3E31_20740 [Chloroflexota bacterium]
MQLQQLSPAMIDNMFQKLLIRDFQQHRPICTAHFECVDGAAGSIIISKPTPSLSSYVFGKQGKTPDPYTVEQMQSL